MKRQLVKRGVNPLADAIRDAVGADPDEPVEIQTPQFERTPGMQGPSSPPATRQEWDGLADLDVIALMEMGLHRWNESNAEGRILMLLPGEWYAHIPDGYPLVCISGRHEAFHAGQTDNDTRYGCLAFGVLATERGGN